MHIPDGFLAAPVWAALGAASFPSVGYIARRAQAQIEERRAPLLGVMGAFVFAAQMINFPVGAGTTGHLVGGALLAFTLGPAAAAVVMTAILAIQAVVFQDGGVLALGANVFNMAIAGVFAGYLPYHYWGSGRRRNAAIFLGAALSVLVGALLAMSELLISGVRMPLGMVWVSLGLFSINAVLEGGITLAVIRSLEAVNPAWLRQPEGTGRSALGALLVGAVFLAAVGVLFASANPDGLEALAEKTGIASSARNLWETPLADYETRFFQNPWLRKASAGLAGLGLVFGAGLVLNRIIFRRRRA